MAEISLQIHCKGKEVHEISTPDDIVTEEFITELVNGLRLPETDDDGQRFVWEADNKDSGQILIPGRTLRQNGVLSGHNLYLRSSRPAPQRVVPIPPVVKPPITPLKAIPQPSRPQQWPLWVALALIPVAAAGGYFASKVQSEGLVNQLNDERNSTATARSRAAAAENHAKELEAQLDQIQSSTRDLNTAEAALKAELLTTQGQVAAKDKRLGQMASEMNDLRAANNRSSEDLKKSLAASAQRAQALQSQYAAAQQDLAAAQQKMLPLQQEVAALQRQLGTERNRQRSGFLTWTGDAHKNPVEITGNKASTGTLTGALPGTECTIQATDPERVSIIAKPGPENRWSHVAFRVAAGGKQTVTLIWSVR